MIDITLITNIFSTELFGWDWSLLRAVNSHNSPFLDALMWIVSSHYFGVAFFLMLSCKVFYLYRRGSWKIVAVIAMTVFVTDIVSARVIKPAVQRPRPTHVVESPDGYELHLHQKRDGSLYYGGQYGFPSNHAANFMAMAVMFSYFLKPRMKHYVPASVLIFATVFLVGYSRSYLGVHYPTDVMAGWLLALAISFLSLLIVRKAQTFRWS